MLPQSNQPVAVGAVFRPATRKPDAQIKQEADTAYFGNDVYNLTGASQTATASMPAGESQGYAFLVENDGEAFDGVNVKGCAPSPGFSVSYAINGTDVTGAVEDGTQQFASMAPGAKRRIAVTIASQSGTANGSALSCAITAASANDATKADTVRARLTVG